MGEWVRAREVRVQQEGALTTHPGAPPRGHLRSPCSRGRQRWGGAGAAAGSLEHGPPTHMLAGPFPWGPAGVGGSGPGLVFGSWVEWGNRSVLSAESAGRTPSQLLCGVDSVCGRVFVARMATAGSHPRAGHSGV